MSARARFDRGRRHALRDALIAAGAVGLGAVLLRDRFGGDDGLDGDDAPPAGDDARVSLADADPDPEDASDAFEDRMAALTEAGGGVLHVPPGRWRVSRPVDLTVPGVVVSGAGIRATTIEKVPGTDGSVLRIDADGAVVERLTVRGDRTAREPDDEALPHGIRIGSGASGVVLTDLVVEDAAGYGIGLQGHGPQGQMAGGLFDGFTMRNVRIVGVGNDGIDMKNYDVDEDSCPTQPTSEDPETPASCNGSRSFLRNVSVDGFSLLLPGRNGIDVRGRRHLQNVEVLEVRAGSVGINLRPEVGGRPNGAGAQWSTVENYLVAYADGDDGNGIGGRNVDGTVVDTGLVT